jgi:hypothetical protein
MTRPNPQHPASGAESEVSTSETQLTRDPQIGGYLRPDEGAAFDAYVAQFKLRKGAVATLLIVREIRCGRLPELKEQYSMPTGTGRIRITARPIDISLKQTFEEHVARFDMAPDPAAGIIFRAELLERWLESATFMESA